MNRQARVFTVTALFIASIAFVLFMAGNPAKSGFQAEAHKPKPQSQAVHKEEIFLSAEPPKELPVSPVLQNTNPYLLIDPPPEGKPAPDFSVTTTAGDTLSLSGLKGKKNAVLIFYQGSFCSVCGAQLSNLQKHIGDFNKQDAEIIAISADDMPHAMQTTGERGLTYYGSEDDWSGYDDGTRKMPRELQDAIATGQRVDLGNFSREDIRRIGRSFQNGRPSGVSQMTLSTPGVRLPSLLVTRLTATALPLNEWVSIHCKAFTLPQRPACVAFTIRSCNRLTRRAHSPHGILSHACWSGFGGAHEGCPSLICDSSSRGFGKGTREC